MIWILSLFTFPPHATLTLMAFVRGEMTDTYFPITSILHLAYTFPLRVCDGVMPSTMLCGAFLVRSALDVKQDTQK